MPAEWISGFGTGPRRSGATEADLRCSFCGKHRDQVKSLVAGPTPAVAICDECVDLCTELFAEQDADASA